MTENFPLVKVNSFCGIYFANRNATILIIANIFLERNIIGFSLECLNV